MKRKTGRDKFLRWWKSQERWRREFGYAELDLHSATIAWGAAKRQAARERKR